MHLCLCILRCVYQWVWNLCVSVYAWESIYDCDLNFRCRVYLGYMHVCVFIYVQFCVYIYVCVCMHVLWCV